MKLQSAKGVRFAIRFSTAIDVLKVTCWGVFIDAELHLSPAKTERLFSCSAQVFRFARQ
jgi:hypothetical protein